MGEHSRCVSKFIKDDFFFQAEDGIRDIGVTGVQTCALPIWRSRSRRRAPQEKWLGSWSQVEAALRPPGGWSPGCEAEGDPKDRSEERRVGKERRSRWSPYH